MLKLQKLGKSPGEYNSLFDGQVNSNGDIELLVNYGTKLLIYDSIGRFKKSIGLPFTAVKFCSIGNVRYFYSEYIVRDLNQKFGYRLHEMHGDGKEFFDYLEYKPDGKEIRIKTNLQAFSESGPNYLFCEPFNDNIYEVSTRGIKIKYRLNFIDVSKKPANFNESSEIFDKDKAAAENNLPSIALFTESPKLDFGFYKHVVDGEFAFKFFMYDKKGRKIVGNGNELYLSNINYELHFTEFPGFVSDDGSLISQINPYRLISDLQDNKKKYGEDGIQKIEKYFNIDRKTIDINDNPLLFIYKFKK